MNKYRKIFSVIPTHLILIFFAIVALIPIWIIFISSIKPHVEVYKNQIALPNNVFNVTSGNQSFEVEGLDDTNDVRLTISFGCNAGGNSYTKELLVNFYDDKTTVLLIERVVTCTPVIQVLYE